MAMCSTDPATDPAIMNCQKRRPSWAAAAATSGRKSGGGGGTGRKSRFWNLGVASVAAMRISNHSYGRGGDVSRLNGCFPHRDYDDDDDSDGFLSRHESEPTVESGGEEVAGGGGGPSGRPRGGGGGQDPRMLSGGF
ncbi:hypothetical protein NL676_005794 [Syzygium grande]|nr:hypothetical protein NL676_005794 [Syzygium grande]